MTPQTAKEKAKDLVKRFTYNGLVNWSAARMDAFIFVDEMIEENIQWNQSPQAEERDNFWLSVRKELESLTQS